LGFLLIIDAQKTKKCFDTTPKSANRANVPLGGGNWNAYKLLAREAQRLIKNFTTIGYPP
jgi:hypothetical protein